MSASSGVKVFVRFRPLNEREKSESAAGLVRTSRRDSLRSPRSPRVGGGETGLSFDERTVALGGNSYTYDRVFGETASQEAVFDEVARSSIQDLLEGYNSTIFAYGQTSAGKSHTMFGSPSAKGIVPRCAEGLFAEMAARPGFQWTLEASFLEIYMEQLRDLLRPENGPPLQIREQGRKIWVDGLTQEECNSPDAVLELINRGERSRSTASTGMNEVSSRSHSVVTLTLHGVGQGRRIEARLSLIDLAGSERVGRTGATGQTLKEAQKINQSLSALGNVINALSSGDTGHVPFRDSVLTRLLQEALQGNCKTRLLVACSPHEGNWEETLSSLRFGARAKTVATLVQRNETRDPNANLEARVAELEQQLANETAARQKAEADVARVAQLEQQLVAELAARKQAEAEVVKLRAMLKNGVAVHRSNEKEDDGNNADAKAEPEAPRVVWYEPSRSPFLDEMQMMLPVFFWFQFLEGD